MEVRISQEKFNALLSRNPRKSEIVKERNGDSIPISILEKKMDDLFGAGNWSREVVQSYREINEFIVVLHVSYIHPVTGRECKRSGIGAVPIQVTKNDTEMGPLNVEKKKPQALQYNAPAAQGFAFKNAVKSLGKWFGRDLLRKDKRKVAPEYTNTVSKQIFAFGNAIGAASTMQHIGQIYMEYSELLIHPEYSKQVLSKKAQIENNLKLLPNG